MLEELSKKKAKSKNPLLNLFLMVVIGPAIIVSSTATKYYVGDLVGVALIGWGVWETPEIHPYLKIIVHWKSRSQSGGQNAEVNRSPNAQVNQAGRDINVFNLPPGNHPQPSIVTGLTVSAIVQGQETSETLVSLEAANRGSIPVTVRSMPSLRVLMPDDRAMSPLSDTWASEVEFPFELAPGRSYRIWRDIRGFADSMKKNGYNGRVNLVVELRDDAGRQFRSGLISFDVDYYAKS